MDGVFRIATRGSALALAQTQLVADAVRSHRPELDIEIKTISTAGDRDRISPLWKMTGTGFFTTQVEQALADGDADLAVHSYKDLPTEMHEALTVGAILPRQFPEDVVVTSCEANSIQALPADAVIGTSSPRRTALLRHVRTDLSIQLIRGNVETRLGKAEAGDYDAIVLARAGLERLNLGDKISFVLAPDVFIPAPAQGALAVQCRRDDASMLSVLQGIDDTPTRVTVGAERAVLSALHPGCHAPVGVYASLKDETIEIRAFAADILAVEFIEKTVSGPVGNVDALVKDLIDQLLSAGAEAILKGYQ